MKEPVMPWYPCSTDYSEKVERKYIYSYCESLNEDGYDDEDEDEIEEEVPLKNISDVTLGWLLNQMPKNVTVDDIKIEFGYNASSMAYENHYVKFYYEVTVPAREEELVQAILKYKKEEEQYKKDRAAYEIYCKEQEIKNMQDALSKLKGESNEGGNRKGRVRKP